MVTIIDLLYLYHFSWSQLNWPTCNMTAAGNQLDTDRLAHRNFIVFVGTSQKKHVCVRKLSKKLDI